MTELYMAKTDLLADSVLYQDLYQSLPQWRRDKVDRLQQLGDRQRSVLAWHVLSYAMAQRGYSQQQLAVSFHSLGKPYFNQLPHVFFNLSHTGNRVLCGISDGELGCDVERKREIDLKLSDSFFSAKERELFMSQGDDDLKRYMFFRLWTLKESILKTVGSTVLSMGKLTVHVETNPISVEPNPMVAGPLFLHEFNLGDDYFYSCCTTEVGAVKLCEVDISQFG